jgi:hypothetical protein
MDRWVGGVLIGVGALAAGVGGWYLAEYLQRRNVPSGQPIGPVLPPGGTGTTGSTGSTGSTGTPAGPPAGYVAIQGQYGTIYVRQVPYQQLPPSYPQQCGTAWVGLGPAIAGTEGAFGPGVTENYGVAIFQDGQFQSYSSQRAPTSYGEITGGYVCPSTGSSSGSSSTGSSSRGSSATGGGLQPNPAVAQYLQGIYQGMAAWSNTPSAMQSLVNAAAALYGAPFSVTITPVNGQPVLTEVDFWSNQLGRIAITPQSQGVPV